LTFCWKVLKEMKAVVIFILLLSYVFGWGQEGHKVVGKIASNRLNAATTKLVNTLLGGKTLSDVSTYADDYRSGKGSWTAPMHYVNVPKGSTSFSMKDCPGLCVVKAVQNYTKLVTSGADSTSACNWSGTNTEPCALEFLVHFVGDLHQPLHVGYAEDQGGNLVKVLFFNKSTNLHSAWDSDILARWEGDYLSASQKLEDLLNTDTKFRDQINKLAAITDPIVWAQESFQYILTDVYNFKSNGNTGILDEAYYQLSLPIVQLRLVAAGVRLANTINKALGDSSEFGL